jgi:hypothetical protein
LRREPVRNMSDALIGNDPRVVVDRKGARPAVHDSMQNSRLRFQELLDATGAGRIKIGRVKIHNTY